MSRVLILRRLSRMRFMQDLWKQRLVVRQDSFEELAKIILDFGFWILENCPIPHFKIDRALDAASTDLA